MATKTSPATVAASCSHHWVIGTPAGSVSTGVCKHCGAEREFSSAPERGWVSRPAARKR